MAKTMHVTIATANAGFGYKDERDKRCVYQRGRTYEVSAEFGEHLLSLRAADGITKMFKSIEPAAKVDVGKRERAKNLVDRMAGWDPDKLARFESLAGIVEAGGGVAITAPVADAPVDEPDDEPDDDEGDGEDEGSDPADTGAQGADPAATTTQAPAEPRTLASRKKRRK